MGEGEDKSQMKRVAFLSFMLGAAIVAFVVHPNGLVARVWRLIASSESSENIRMNQGGDSVPSPAWPPPEVNQSSNWVFLKVDGDSWTTGPVGTYGNLSDLLGRQDHLSVETQAKTDLIAIPRLPGVYTPDLKDKCYYDKVLSSEISAGDKVLVIGCGSGADSWVAWLKSQSMIYAVDINPMAVANTRITARLGQFPLNAINGDFRSVDLPDDFKDFDYVLWNMPYLALDADRGLRDMNYFDGDDGTILKSFLQQLPSLLKPEGKAIIWNDPSAKEFIAECGVHAEAYADDWVYVIPNPVPSQE